MKNRFILLLCLCALLLPISAQTNDFINLTPKPRSLTVGEGELVLPQSFVVSTADVPDDFATEAQKFVDAFNYATGYNAVAATDGDALIRIKQSNSAMGDECYALTITTTGVDIEANTATGLYFAFQTIKKILPPNVMAGVKDEAVTKYALPVVDITDYPRFGYRGFMLDVSRHFFTVEEVKRVIDVMSYYKMNRFHWHLTDDHGWRVEIKKYPKLTTIGSISDNSYVVDMKYGDYWLNHPYGPYFYTQDQLREVVAYAKERHIEIIPEVDMPGHFCAAMASYPEFSCTPEGSHSVISNIGGVFSDVLNVANPKAVQFAKDIVSELMDIFPYEYIHIGGDECPTTAWEKNAACIARKEEMGMTSFRQLQSYFIKDMADFAKERGRKLIVWNEAITASGADTKTIQDSEATVMCWVGADGAVAKSANLQLDHIYTPQVPWYINRKQSTDPSEPVAAGAGTDNLEAVYQQNIPVPSGNAAKYFKGVQGTFWCEYVAFPNYLEYLMLPRLVAIAEAGWTPQAKRSFSDFCRRITADSVLYNYNNYNYGRHYMQPNASATDKVMPKVSTDEKKHWYRIVTRAAAPRADRCIELLADDSPLISEYSGKQAQAGRLWTNAQAAEGDAAYDYQFWAIEEDPSNAGHYALVCKAQPAGSVNPQPTANSTSGRWDYDNANKHYNFMLADNGYGKDGDTYYYSIRCDQVENLWLNASLAGQGFAVNLYGKPSDGSGGLWNFLPLGVTEGADAVIALLNEARTYLDGAVVREAEDVRWLWPGTFMKTETENLQQLIEGVDVEAMSAEELAAFNAQLTEAYDAFRRSFGYLVEGETYWLGNAVEGFEGIGITDDNVGNLLRHTTDFWADDVWVVEKSTIADDYSQTVVLRNYFTGRYIGTAATSTTGRVGYPVAVGETGGEVRIDYQPATVDYILSNSGKNFYPVAENSVTAPGTICSGSTTGKGNAVRPMGAAWTILSVKPEVYHCVDTEGRDLGTYHHAFRKMYDYTVPYHCPDIKNHRFKEKGDSVWIYERIGYSLTTVCRDEHGAIISAEEQTCPVGETIVVNYPEHPYYTLTEAATPDGASLTANCDTLVEARYTTTAHAGVKRVAQAVTEIVPGRSYLLYDTSPVDTERKGFRRVNSALQVMKSNGAEDVDPNHTWTLEPSGKGYKVKNELHGLYVPLLTTAATPVTLTTDGAVYNFTLNADGETWKIKGTNGVCWDGLGSGALVGWNDPGHPYRLYEYYVQPYFDVVVQAIDEEEHVLGTTTALVKAGEAYTLQADTYEGYIIKEVLGADDLGAVGNHTTVTIVYEPDPALGIGKVNTERKIHGIYDLSGRRLQRIERPGLYIINGQKVLVK